MLQLTPLKDTLGLSNKSNSSKGNIPYFTSLSLVFGYRTFPIGKRYLFNWNKKSVMSFPRLFTSFVVSETRTNLKP